MFTNLFELRFKAVQSGMMVQMVHLAIQLFRKSSIDGPTEKFSRIIKFSRAYQFKHLRVQLHGPNPWML